MKTTTSSLSPLKTKIKICRMVMIKRKEINKKTPSTRKSSKMLGNPNAKKETTRPMKQLRSKKSLKKKQQHKKKKRRKKNKRNQQVKTTNRQVKLK